MYSVEMRGDVTCICLNELEGSDEAERFFSSHYST